MKLWGITRKVLLCASLFFVSRGSELEAPTRVAAFPAPDPVVTTEKWSGGSLIRYQGYTVASEHGDNFFVYDEHGNQVLKRRVWLPDAWALAIHDVAGSRKGDVALTGVAFESSGSIAEFFAILPLGGGTASVIATAPFEGQKIVYGPDNSLWVFGWELGSNRTVGTARPHAMLRHFTAAGEFLAGYLPWPLYACAEGHPASTLGGIPRLAVSEDRLALLSRTCNKLMEISFDGTILANWDFPSPPARDVAAGIAITRANEIFADFGGTLFRFHRVMRAWEPVLTATGERNGVRLLGSEGNSLVVDEGNSRMHASWRSVKLNGPGATQ